MESAEELKIIYEDTDIIAVNKPPGINVHPDETYKKETLIQKISKLYPEILKIGENLERPGVVHRLDRDTSGVLILAKNEKSFNFLKDSFKIREVKKTYLALLQGKLGTKKYETGIINLPLARSVKNPILRTAIGKTRGELKPAITEYKILGYFEPKIKVGLENQKNILTLLEAYPKTGRTHQLRVHFKALGHPIAGDKLYGNKNKIIIHGLTRHFLHAMSLELTLPSGTRIKLEAELPEDLKKVLNNLKETNN